VLRDPRVALSVRERRPFVLGSPGCPASACLHRLAHRLDRHASDPRAQGLLHRMTHWLTG